MGLKKSYFRKLHPKPCEFFKDCVENKEDKCSKHYMFCPLYRKKKMERAKKLGEEAQALTKRARDFYGKKPKINYHVDD